MAEDEVRRVAGDGEADALGAHDHRGVHADHLAGAGHQRTAGVAGVDGRIGLNESLELVANV